MRWRVPALVTLAVLMPPAGAIAQIGQSAALGGAVADAQGKALPGVTVTVTDPSIAGGARTAVTGGDGQYRFVSIPPGLYHVTFEVQGFAPQIRERVRLQLGESIALRVALEAGTSQKPAADAAWALLADVAASAPRKHLTADVLEQVPLFSRSGADAMRRAPGVHPITSSLYGSNGGTSNAFLLDGADMSDPNTGAAAVTAGYTWIQEAVVASLGMAAEHSGYTGSASFILLRSGGDRFHGLFETRYSGGAMVSDNTTAALLARNPDLAAGTTNCANDTAMQVGGPIRKARAWFFAGFQYSRLKLTPEGYPPGNPVSGEAWVSSMGGPDSRVERFPRFLVKPTWQITTNHRLTGFAAMERRTADGIGAGARVSPEATLKQTAPALAWNANHTMALTSATVVDVKYSGLRRRDDTDPYGPLDVAGWYDGDTGVSSKNARSWRHADGSRQQAQVTMSTFASGFAGTHALKFGAEYERSRASTSRGFPGGGEIYAYSGIPYYQYQQESSVLEGTNRRVAAFAQNEWALTKTLTLNLGARWDRYAGRNAGLGTTVFTTTGVAPRLGLAWDVHGNGKTVLRAHAGDFYEGARTSFYQGVDPRQPPRYIVAIEPITLKPISPPHLTAVFANRTVATGIRHPFVRQGTLGIVREWWPGITVGATYIYRRNHHDIEDVLDPASATFATYEYADPGADGIPATGDENGELLTVYNQTSSLLNNRYIITNPAGAFRQYHGVEIQWARRSSERWMLQGSWVISRTTGTITNNREDSASAEFDDPNIDPTTQLFREGRLSGDTTHTIRVLAWYRAPYGFGLSGDVWYVSGDTYARVVRPTANQGRQEMFIEPRGSRRYPGQSAVNVKVDRTIALSGQRRVDVAFEVFSLLNRSTVTSVTVQTPISPASTPFGTPQRLVEPRRMILSAAFRF